MEGMKRRRKRIGEKEEGEEKEEEEIWQKDKKGENEEMKRRRRQWQHVLETFANMNRLIVTAKNQKQIKCLTARDWACISRRVQNAQGALLKARKKDEEEKEQ